MDDQGTQTPSKTRQVGHSAVPVTLRRGMFHRYCRVFRPRSRKNVNLVRVNRLVIYPIVKVKSQRAWYKVQNLIRNLNVDERKWALSLSFHPYHARYQENTQTQMEMARQGASKKQLNAYRTKKEQLDFLWETERRLRYVRETN